MDITELLAKFAERLLLDAIPILIPLVAAIVVKLLADAWNAVRVWRPNFADSLGAAADTAINAAEKVGLLGELGEVGKYKLDYAVEIMQAWLNRDGHKNVDLTIIRAAIESALLRADFPHAKAE
jgi:hypothetical protein